MPSALAFVAGADQSGPAGRPLPDSLTVVATDAAGRPVPGVVVRWSVVDLEPNAPTLGAAVAPDSTRTDASGRASVEVILGQLPGRYSVAATATAAPPGGGEVPAIVQHAEVAALVGPLARLAPDARSIPVGSVVRLAAVDAFGNPLPDSATGWSTGDPAILSVSPDGTATAGSPGGTTVTARAGGVILDVPFTVLAPAALRSLAAGDAHACGLDAAGAAWCWGRRGPWLGSADTLAGCYYDTRGPALQGDRCAPRPVAVTGGLSFTALAAGGVQTCGLVPAGVLYCWGRGQTTGTGAAYDVDHPVQVAGDARYVALSAGADHTCALDDGGAAFCWGANATGQLGDGTFEDRALPTTVAGGLSLTALTAGAVVTCGIAQGGAAWCWGDDTHGELGNGATVSGSPSGLARPTAVAGGLSFTRISAGGGHVCALAADGAAYCWGRNDAGQLGDGTTTPRTAPTPVAGGRAFTDISAGNAYTCAVAADGGAWCWGDNRSGQLGTGDTASVAVPAAVAGGLRFRAVTASLETSFVPNTPAAFTCGTTTAGEAWCWGWNALGQLGDGLFTLTPRPAPGGVAPPS